MVVDSTVLRGDLHRLANVLDWRRRRNIHPHKLDWHILKAGWLKGTDLTHFIFPDLWHMHDMGLLGDGHGDLVDPGRPGVVVVVVLVLVVVIVVLWLAVIGGGRALMGSII